MFILALTSIFRQVSKSFNHLNALNCNTVYKMDFQSAMETFAEAWVAANTKGGSLSDVGCSQVSHLLTLIHFKQFNINAEMFVCVQI